MDSVGDQHKENGALTVNPFEEIKPQITAYTASEIATLQAKLDKQLGPEYVSVRPGPSGTKINYLSGEKAINLANEVFGFNGWSSSIQNIQIDFVDEHPQNEKISLGLSVVVRITLKDGTYHEDIGYGHIDNCKGKAAAFAKAKKEGTTDGLKRALRTFGKVLGNCIYDKDYLKRVTRMKVGQARWDEAELHRHTDYVPTKRAKTEKDSSAESVSDTKLEREPRMEEDFDPAEFDDAEFGDDDFLDPDQIILPDPIHEQRTAAIGTAQTRKPPQIDINTPSRPPNVRTATAPSAPPNRNQSNQQPQSRQNERPIPATANAHISRPQPPPQSPAPRQQTPANTRGGADTYSPDVQSMHFAGLQDQRSAAPTNAGNPVSGFYSAKAASLLDEQNNPQDASTRPPTFNPHAETPSIRKTAGVDHTRSGKVRKDVLAVAALGSTTLVEYGPAPAITDTSGRNFINPHAEAGRRVGAPASAMSNMSPMNTRSAAARGSPMTSAYRPPTRHGGPNGPNAIQLVSESGPMAANSEAAYIQSAQRGPLKRPPLGDVSNLQPPQSYPHPAVSGNADTSPAKRQRLGGYDGQNDIIKPQDTTVAVDASNGKENADTVTALQVPIINSGTNDMMAAAPMTT